MTLTMTELAGQSQELIFVGFLVFLRIGAMLAVVPAFGEQSVPVRVKLALATAFTIIVLPAAMSEIGTVPVSLLSALPMGGAEVVTGLFFGIVLRFFVIALQVAGSIAAQSTSLSQLFGGSAGQDPLPAMAHVLVVAGLALATLLGLHVQLASYMVLSYEIVQFGTMPSAQDVVEAGLVEVTRCFAMGFALAGPFVVASLLYNVTLGVINKAMPQLMVAFVGAPAITAGGLALLMISAPILLSLWGTNLFEFLQSPFGAVQ